MLSISPESRFSLNEDLLLRAIADINRFYAFNLANGDHFRLNETAYRSLEIINAGISFDDLVQKYAAEFELGRQKAAQDLLTVLEFALNNNLIKEVH